MEQTLRTVLPVTNSTLIAFRMYVNYTLRGELESTRLGQFAKSQVNKVVRQTILNAAADANETLHARRLGFIHNRAIELIHSVIADYKNGLYFDDVDIVDEIIGVVDYEISLHFLSASEREQYRYD